MTDVTQDQVRETLTAVWKEILDVQPSDDDDFFEVGGGSMELVMLLVAVGEQFGATMSIDELFPDTFTFRSCVSAVAAAVRAEPVVHERTGAA